ncbi:MAG: hypothetical protein JJ975_10470 [Bacteroidia bacterium]|nr:hypothetical protein [Bacteroidia bacterium]
MKYILPLFVLALACNPRMEPLDQQVIDAQLDSVYMQYEAEVDSFIQAIDALPAVLALDHPMDTFKVESLDSFEVIQFLNNLRLEENYIPYSDTPSYTNCLYITAAHNLGLLPRSFDTTYSIQDPNEAELKQENIGMKAARELAQRSQLGKWKTNAYFTSENVIHQRYARGIDQLRSIKYVLVIDDLIYSAPHVVSEDLFESGVLVTLVTAYNLETGKEIGKAKLISQNSDEIQEISSGMYAMDRNHIIANQQLRSDLDRNRFKEIATSFGLSPIEDDLFEGLDLEE